MNRLSSLTHQCFTKKSVVAISESLDPVNMTSVLQANEERDRKVLKFPVSQTVDQDWRAETLRKDGEGGLAR